MWLITDEPDLAFQQTNQFHNAISKTIIASDDFVGPVCLWAITIGAGPTDYFIVTDDMVAAFNRPNDMGSELGNPSLIKSFSDKSDALAFLNGISTMNQTMNANFANTTLVQRQNYSAT